MTLQGLYFYTYFCIWMYMVSLPPAAGMEGEVSEEIPLDILCHSKHPNTSQVHPNLYEMRLALHLSLHSYHTCTSAHNHRLNKLLRVKYALKGREQSCKLGPKITCFPQRGSHFLCAVLILSLFLVIDTEHSKKLFLKSHRRRSSALGHGVSHWGDISVECSKT